MSDPVYEAAERAELNYNGGPPRDWRNWERSARKTRQMVAAREALRPIRELHKPTSNGTPGHPMPYCVGCGEDWPCQTAELCYTSEDLDQ